MSQAANPPVKLSRQTLASLPSRVATPGYERSTPKRNIVHIGVGGFFRAHQAVYLDDLMQAGLAEGWAYCGVGLLQHDVRIRDAMRTQDCLYAVLERGGDGENVRIIGAISDFLYAPDEAEAVLEKMAHEDTLIVSLTITEGGYYVNHGSGEFDAQHADILHDLAHPHAPRCSFGYLAEALDRRRRRGLPPFTVMSCDNLQNNGDVTRKMLLAFATLRDPVLGAWLEQHGAFPNSMVDRITPATTNEHIALVRSEFGIDDAWPVMTEPFRQWVIEEHFPLGRPAWEKAGAQMTSDVLPYEKMKLRLLNASHQALCYVGMLLGYEFAHEAMADPAIRRLVRDMMDHEVTALLPAVEGVDLEEYKATLIERFSNPAIRDQLTRIGTEGSARIPKFVLPSIIEQLQRGGPTTLLSFTVASWFRYLRGSDDNGKPLTIIDPLSAELRARALRGGSHPGELLAMRELFGELSESAALAEQIGTHLRALYHAGARAALDAVVATAAAE